MSTSISRETLPITETVTPVDQAGVSTVLRDVYERGTALYTIGGGTSIGYGAASETSGIGLAVSGLKKIVDYPARDMTITVEAGITMRALAEELAKERQCLPVDVPQVEQATLGGVIATDTSGARRLGRGTMRDYVIGISAVDGRGTPFNGGGRVVKNVAGYDFCKLLTGSMGTLGVITQVTLKVVPIPEASALLCQPVASLTQAESLLAALVNTRTSPVAIEVVGDVLGGYTWSKRPLVSDGSAAVAYLLVGLEGTVQEVNWMVDTLQSEWASLGVKGAELIAEDSARATWKHLAEFAIAEDANAIAPVVVKASISPGSTVSFLEKLANTGVRCSYQAHAARGVVKIRSDELPVKRSSDFVEQIRREARATGGHATVWVSLAGSLTREELWGPPSHAQRIMHSIKSQFDPKGLLNPGRFIFNA